MEYTNGMAICSLLCNSNSIPGMDDLDQKMTEAFVIGIVLVYVAWVIYDIRTRK